LDAPQDYVEGLADTLDLVPIGAWWGNGRKAGWFSPWLMAAIDTDTGELQSLCRVMSGFTDAFYK
jgi:DNA ligase-1